MERGTSAETAAAVRAELARRNVKQKDLVDSLGWKKSTVSRRLAGEYPFKITELAQLAAHLGCPLSALLPTTDVAA